MRLKSQIDKKKLSLLIKLSHVLLNFPLPMYTTKRSKTTQVPIKKNTPWP